MKIKFAFKNIFVLYSLISVKSRVDLKIELKLDVAYLRIGGTKILFKLNQFMEFSFSVAVLNVVSDTHLGFSYASKLFSEHFNCGKVEGKCHA